MVQFSKSCFFASSYGFPKYAEAVFLTATAGILRVGLAWFFTSEQKMITEQMIDSELSHLEQADDNAKKYLQIQAVYGTCLIFYLLMK